MTCPERTEPYYANGAYRPDRIPEQVDAPRRLNGMRLPWGRTQEVMPDNVMEDPTPEKMRFSEALENKKAQAKAKGTYIPAPFEHLELHYRYDHEVMRHAQWPFRAQFWILLKTVGKWGAIILAVTMIPAHLIMISTDEPVWDVTYHLIVNLYSWVLGIPIICAIIGHIVVEHCPKIWIKAPKGPLWELNRRTGMVKVFTYKNFKKTGKPDEEEAPFYEFDAYIFIQVGHMGPPLKGLCLRHRYRDIVIHFNNIIAPDDGIGRPCALWDFLQNYMDISRPLPDAPLHEPYRHLDPVTAEYDRQTGRDPRYWIDMDTKVFKARVKEMCGRMDAIDTATRPNLMARYVRYAE